MSEENSDDFVHHEQPQFDLFSAMKTVAPKPIAPPAKGQRAQNLKALREHDIRQKIMNSKQLEQAFKCLDEIEKIHKSIAKINADKFTRGHQAKYTTMLGALKIKLDAHMRFLNKIVPDLKTVDLGESSEGGPVLRLMVYSPEEEEGNVNEG